jgi:hypothetical protein
LTRSTRQVRHRHAGLALTVALAGGNVGDSTMDVQHYPVARRPSQFDVVVLGLGAEKVECPIGVDTVDEHRHALGLSISARCAKTSSACAQARSCESLQVSWATLCFVSIHLHSP